MPGQNRPWIEPRCESETDVDKRVRGLRGVGLGERAGRAANLQLAFLSGVRDALSGSQRQQWVVWFAVMVWAGVDPGPC